MDRQQTARERGVIRRFHRAAAHKCQPVAIDIDHPPAGAAQARIDAKDADGGANRLSGHGIVITSEPGERNTNSASVPAKPSWLFGATTAHPSCAGLTRASVQNENLLQGDGL